jgi:DNA invertase Pin-like site-specific DNA recombinase
MKSVAIYVRVSSKSQDTRSQEADLKRWAEGQDGIVWYRDKATGTKMERPGMDALMGDIEAGKVGKVVVWRLDRLGRTAAGLTKLFDDLTARKVGLFSMRESLDLETPAGRLMACVLASVSCYEGEIRRERQQAGIAAAKAAGRTWGGSKPGRRLTITDEQVSVAKRLRREGFGISAISRAIGLTRPSIYRLLSE